MKTILEFDPIEETEELYWAQHGGQYSIILEYIDSWLRNMEKYENKKNIQIKAVRDKILELKQEYEVK